MERLIICLCVVPCLLAMTTPAVDELKVCDPVDIAFIVDTSSSLWYKHFKLQIKFIHDIVSLWDIGPGDQQSRAAAVSFSSRLFPEFGFSDSQSKKSVLAAVNNITYVAGDATRMYLGLEYAHDTIYAPGNGERSNVSNVVVILTDGVTNPGHYDNFTRDVGKKLTQTQAARVRGLPANLFAIGIGNDVDENEVRGMASKPAESYSLFVNNFDDLNSNFVKRSVLQKVCGSLPQKIEECKQTKADVFFVVDESSSLHRHENFQKELNFVASVIDQLEVGRDDVRVGMMTFSSDPRMLFQLNDFKTKKQIASLLKYIPWRGGDTYLDKALKLLMSDGLVASQGSRNNVPQITIVITDGQSTNPRETEKMLVELRRMNFIVFAIGVGPNRDPTELQRIASDPSYVLEVENIDGLVEIRKKLITQLCPGDRPEPPKPITCQGAIADIIFIADSSTSIGITAFNDLKEFAKSVVKRFTIGPNNIKIGLITFANDAEFQFRLDTFNDKDEVIKAITSMPYSTGNTNTHKALEILNKFAFTPNFGGRGNRVPKIAIVITDGSSRQPTLTRTLAIKAKQQGIMMFSIGVGPYIDQNELDIMASSPTSMYSFSVDSFAALSSIEGSLANRTCTAAVRRNP
ncbi:collagen alpha-6(VI) chain-like isoform X1 [Mytilus edulis]|uniref:collagen alpha-6(VI) chain-like isoform X1 n=1 Tax=Mytilus edulis TaxID=6550 RepID=UPI0039F11024